MKSCFHAIAALWLLCALPAPLQAAPTRADQGFQFGATGPTLVPSGGNLKSSVPVTAPGFQFGTGGPTVNSFDATMQNVGGVEGVAPFITNGGLNALTAPQRAASFLSIDDFAGPPYGLSYTDGSMTAGSNVLTTTAAHFLPSDVGSGIWVVGQRADGGTQYGTITAYNSPTSVNLSFNAVVNSPTYGIASVKIAANGSNYAAGDTVTIHGNTGQTVDTTVQILDTQVSAIAINNGGGGGTNSANCSMMGTTGNLRFKKNVTYVTFYVTISGGTITAINSILNNGDYTTNPNIYANGGLTEPVVPAQLYSGALRVDACAAFTGAQPTMRLTTSVSPAATAMVVTQYGAFSSQQSNNTVFTTTTSGLGTGLTLNQSTNRQNTGLYTYGPEANAGIAKAINIANADQALGMRNVLWFSSGECANAGNANVACSSVRSTGVYILGPSMALPTLNNGVEVRGQGKANTLIYKAYNYPGTAALIFAGNTLISPGETINPVTLSFSPAWRGSAVSDLTIVGDLTATSQSDAIDFDDVSTYVNIRDVDVIDNPGRCLGLGVAITTGNQAKNSESRFTNLHCWYTGGWYGGGQLQGGGVVPTIDDMVLKPSGGTSQDDQRFLNIDIYSPAGKCIWMHGSTGGGLGNDFFTNIRCEGGHATGTDDQIALGDVVSTDGANVNNTNFDNLQMIDPRYGSFAIHTMAPAGTTLANLVNNVHFNHVTIAGGQPFGGGVAFDACWWCDVQISNTGADGVDFQSGYSAAGGSAQAVNVSLNTVEDTSTWNINNPTIVPVNMAAYVAGGLGVSGGQMAIPLNGIGTLVPPLVAGQVPAQYIPAQSATVNALQTATGTSCSAGAYQITALWTVFQSGGGTYADLPAIPTGQKYDVWNNTGNAITICSASNAGVGSQNFKYATTGYSLPSQGHVGVAAVSTGTLEVTP